MSSSERNEAGVDTSGSGLVSKRKVLNDPIKFKNYLEKIVNLSTFKESKTEPDEVVIKVEPTFDFLPETDEDFVTLCRCCFKTTPVSQVMDDLTVLSAFEEIIQMNLEPNQHAATFCKICCEQIRTLRDFRRLAIAKQNKFCETLITGSTDFSDLSQMTVLDPLDTFIKEEPEDVKLVDFQHDFYPRVELFRLDQEEIEKLSNHVDKKVPKVGKKKYSLPATTTCPLCHKNYRKLQKHINRVHSEYENLICNLCGYRAFNKETLRTHMTKHEGKIFHEKRKHGPRKMRPPMKSVAKHSSSFKQHDMEKNRKMFKFPCKNCIKEFKTMKELRSHEENKHLEKLLVCETCGKKCGNFKALSKHQLWHSENKFGCFICGKKFYIKYFLECHIRCRHLKERNFKCEKCDRSFFTRPKLNRHMNTHNNIRFHCFLPGCSSSLARRDGLITHMRSHRLTGSAMEDYMRQLNDYCDELKKLEKVTTF